MTKTELHDAVMDRFIANLKLGAAAKKEQDAAPTRVPVPAG